MKYNKIKYIYLILLLLIISSLLIIKKSSNINYNKDTELLNFEEEIKKYPSYNKDMLNKYFEEYKKSNNIVYSLNIVNYPNYYDDIVKEPYFKIDYYLTLINKKYYIDESFNLNNLVEITNVHKIIRENETMKLNEECFNSYLKMYEHAKSLNIDLVVYSSYRSIDKQINIYNNSKNNSLVAKPYHSEHHTGLSIDIATLESGLTNHFEYTDSFKFLNNYAHLYGFILRYPKNKEQITGYNYEPWHYRYVGIKHAKIIKEQNITLEEYIYTNILL